MRTPLGPGGEFDVIRRIAERWGERAREIGDDAAVLPIAPGLNLVLSVDASVEDVHFRRGWLSPREIAYRAVTAALSDVAAMAATPIGVLTTIALPDGWRDAADELADGIGEAAAASDAEILGGDLTRAGELSVGVTVIGAVGEPLRRRGAGVGDDVYVTGCLGGAGAALRAWSSGRTPELVHRQRFARPSARVREAAWLAQRGASACIDVSDGFIADLQHVAAASGVRIRVDLEQVPAIAGVSARDAVASGEEYELAVTCPFQLDTAAFRNAFGIELTAVGRVSAVDDRGPGVDVYERGVVVDPPSGYDHFSR